MIDGKKPLVAVENIKDWSIGYRFYEELDTFSLIPNATITMYNNLEADLVLRCKLVTTNMRPNFANDNKPSKDYAYKPIRPSYLPRRD